MEEPAIALVFSPEPWVEALHRHCTDHGGARVHHVVVEPRVALEEWYDTLVVSHRWPALTAAFVTALHRRGRRVLGIFDIHEPAGHQHLSTLGVDGIVAADASMATFVDAIAALGAAAAPEARERELSEGDHRPLGRLVAVGGTSGAGATEVAVALADAIGEGSDRTVLVDADEGAPSVTARLGLAVEPNLRTAIDHLVHDRGPVALSTLGRRGGLAVLGGLPSTAGWSQVRAEEVLLVLEQLARDHAVLVVNVHSRLEMVGDDGRDRFAISRAVVGVADAIVGVVAPTPVGVVRAVDWAVDVRVLARTCPLHVIVNRAPRDRFRRSEVVTELERSIDATSFGVAPEDPRVADAAWAGTLVRRGRFARAVRDLVSDLGVRSTSHDRMATT